MVIVRNKIKVTALPKHPEDGCAPLKGDMWELKFNGMCDACLGFDFCVTVRDLTGIKLQETSDVHVGLLIESILSIVCAYEICQLASLDLHVNRELKGNGTADDHCLQLTMLIGC